MSVIGDNDITISAYEYVDILLHGYLLHAMAARDTIEVRRTIITVRVRHDWININDASSEWNHKQAYVSSYVSVHKEYILVEHCSR